MQGGSGGVIELVGESVAGCSSVVACALVSYVLHGDVDARPLLEDEAAAVQNFLYLAAAASLSNLPSLYDAALDQLGQLLQVEFNTLIKEAYPEAAADISLIQPLGLFDLEAPHELEGFAHFDDAELAAALEGSGCVTLLKMISASELAFAEPQLTQSVFTLAASCYRVLGRLEDQSGHGDWGPDDAGRGLARLTWAQRAGLLGAYRVPPRRRPEDAHRCGTGPSRAPPPSPSASSAAPSSRRSARVQGPAARRAWLEEAQVARGGQARRRGLVGVAQAPPRRDRRRRGGGARRGDRTARGPRGVAAQIGRGRRVAAPRRPLEAAAAPAPAGAAQQGFEASVHVARRPDHLGVPECAHVRARRARTSRRLARRHKSSRWRRSSRHASIGAQASLVYIAP